MRASAPRVRNLTWRIALRTGTTWGADRDCKNALILAGLNVVLLPAISNAQDSRNEGHLVDSCAISIAKRSSMKMCWRRSDSTPAHSGEPSDSAARKAVASEPRVAAASLPPEKVTAEKPQPAPAKAAPQNVNYSTDTPFAFDNAVLGPADKTALDAFARQLGEAMYEVVSRRGIPSASRLELLTRLSSRDVECIASADLR
jgi:hypothetical protein